MHQFSRGSFRTGRARLPPSRNEVKAPFSKRLRRSVALPCCLLEGIETASTHSNPRTDQELSTRLPRPKRCRTCAFVVAVLAVIAAVGPADAQVRTDEEVLFFPTAARLNETGDAWLVPIHGWIYEPESDGIVRRAVLSRLANELELEDSEGKKTLSERARWLLVDNERGKRIEIAVGDERHTLPPSTEDGHFEDVLTLPVELVERLAVDRRLTFRAVLPEGDERDFTGAAVLVPLTGLTVISDIDDTVKISEVTNRKRLLRRTFVEPFEAVEGMAALYRDWTEAGAVMHFVSSSPWQLYSSLEAFFAESGFPHAVWQMKRIRLKDPSVLRLFGDPYEYKLAEITAILRTFPERRFALIGDSGEKDPETYGELARRFPEQIVTIAIRDVTDEPADADRYDAAFRDVRPDRWQVFQHSGEIVLPFGD